MLLQKEEMTTSTIVRGYMRDIVSDTIHLAVISGALLETNWSRDANMKAGFQLGIKLGLLRTIYDSETSLVPMGQIWCSL